MKGFSKVYYEVAVEGLTTNYDRRKPSPRRSVRAGLPHTAPTLSTWRQISGSDKDDTIADEESTAFEGGRIDPTSSVV